MVMRKGGETFIHNVPSYSDKNDISFIFPNRLQNLEFPKEYPALIQVHLEEPAMDFPTHWHPAPELIYSRNRELVVNIEGKKICLKPGGFVLVSSYALHSIHPKLGAERQDVMSIVFQSGYLERMLPQLRSYKISQDAPKATDEAKAQIIRFCEQLRQQIEKQSDFFETNQILFSILQLIYTDFLDGMQKDDPKLLNSRTQMMKILDYVEKNYQQPLTTQSVASHFGYTREYFCRMFRRYGNYTFKQYLTDLRLNAVVEELRLSDKNIAKIAMAHGFPDEKGFYNAFKKKYGVTPMQYRNNGNETD